MRRGVLATGVLNMLKPIDRRDRRNGTNQIAEELQNDPTLKPVYGRRDGDDEADGDAPRRESLTATAAPTNAIALDLDLFDPDEDD